MAGIVYSKSAGVADSIFGKSQEPILAIVEEQVEAYQQKSLLDQLFAMETTENFAEKLTSETALGNFMPVGEAGAYPRNSFREGFSKVIEPETWKNSFEVTAEMVEDAKHGKIKRTAQTFASSYHRTREMLGAAMYMGGVGPSINVGVGSAAKTFSTTSADGMPLFSTAHPSATGGYAGQCNLFNEDFTYEAFCYMQEKMQNFRDDDGNLLGVTPDTILIPNDAMLKKAVFNAVGAEGIPNDTSGSSMNFQCGLWTVIVHPYLNQFIPTGATSKPWMMLDSAFMKEQYGAVWLDRLNLTVRSEIADNDNNVWKGRSRFLPGFYNWRFAGMSYIGSDGIPLK